MNEKEKAYYYWLVNVPKLNAASRRKLLDKFGTARDVYFLAERHAVELLGEKQAQSYLNGKQKWEVEREYEKLQEKGICFTGYGMKEYPTRLLHIPSPPAALYYKGHLPNDNRPSVAIVGARMCSEYGAFAAKEFGSKLGAAGIQIISGLAMGIDGISQRAAIEAGADSFGVLGCGVDVCYPQSNRNLYERLLSQGGVISEFPPGTSPRAQNFPSRNRIISGLADLVLVVEAKEKSGTGITVDMALEQGREVYAVPGRITDELSKGCHKLIRQGAGIAAGAEDIIAALYYEETAMTGKEKVLKKSEKDSVVAAAFTLKEQAIWSVLDRWPMSIQEIYDRLSEKKISVSIKDTMEILMNLCLKGFVETKNGGYMKKEIFL